MRRFDGLPVVVVVAALLACGGAAPKPQVSAQAAQVQVGKGDPPAGYVQMQTLEVQHGSGCGLYGTKGNFDGAYAMLRDAGHKIGADYVQIMTVQEPYSDGQCAHQEYRMTGVAYRKGQLSGAVAASVAPAAPAAATRACVPGATQACLGPGACKGAQVCKDDGLAYGACDCGTGTAQAPAPAPAPNPTPLTAAAAPPAHS